MSVFKGVLNKPTSELEGYGYMNTTPQHIRNHTSPPCIKGSKHCSLDFQILEGIQDPDSQSIKRETRSHAKGHYYYSCNNPKARYTSYVQHLFVYYGLSTSTTDTTCVWSWKTKIIYKVFKILFFVSRNTIVLQKFIQTVFVN